MKRNELMAKKSSYRYREVLVGGFVWLVSWSVIWLVNNVGHLFKRLFELSFTRR